MIDFGLVHSGIRPTFQCKGKLKEGKLGFSASEQFKFLKYFGLLIGDKIPQDNKYWGLYACLYDIVRILRQPSFNSNDIICLKTLVFLDDKNQLYFLVKSLKIEEFSSHVNAYKIKLTHKWRCLSYESLRYAKTSCILYNVNGNAFVAWY